MPECVIDLPAWHPKQQIAFDTEATDILYAGDTRSGKSFWFRKASIRWCAEIPGLIVGAFRLNWSDVYGELMEGESSYPVLLHTWAQNGLVKITQTDVTFWNGSIISLDHCSEDTVLLNHRGRAKHVLAFLEATQIPEHRIRGLSGWCTMSEEMKARVPEKWKGRFPKILHLTNPIGESAGYYRRSFVDIRPPYAIEQVGQHRRQYIPAFADDNPSEDQTQTRERIRESFPDKATQDALISKDPSGVKNWHSVVGEFFTEWNPDSHVVADFYPPNHWFRFRTFDWGYAEPACVHWWGISDGEPFKDEDGYERWFPRGALVCFFEWYICRSEKEPSEGARMSNEDTARGIIERSELQFKRVITLADSKPFQSTGGEKPSDTFARLDCRLDPADDSRVAGWQQLHSRLHGYKTFDSTASGEIIVRRIPMVYFCERCRYVIRYIPALPRHPSESKREDAAEHGEATHACDSARYATMAHTRAVIKDRLQPVESRIAREVKASRPTMQKIVKSTGGAYFG